MLKIKRAIGDAIRIGHRPDSMMREGILRITSDNDILDADAEDDEIIQNIIEQVMGLDVVVKELNRVSRPPRPDDEYIELLRQINGMEKLEDFINLVVLARTELDKINDGV